MLGLGRRGFGARGFRLNPVNSLGFRSDFGFGAWSSALQGLHFEGSEVWALLGFMGFGVFSGFHKGTEGANDFQVLLSA